MGKLSDSLSETIASLVGITGNRASKGTQVFDHHAKEKAEILVECSDALIESLDDMTKSQNKLGRKVFWLNVVLASATVVGAIATAALATDNLYRLWELLIQ